MGACRFIAITVDEWGTVTEGEISPLEESEALALKASCEADLVAAGYRVDVSEQVWTKSGVGGWTEFVVEAVESEGEKEASDAWEVDRER